MAFVTGEDNHQLLAAACLLIIDSSDSEVEEAISVEASGSSVIIAQQIFGFMSTG